MAITFRNDHGIPSALANAISSDEKLTYGRFSVTQLLAPPRIRRLLAQHDVEVDVSERLWAILGKGVHAVLAGHAGQTSSAEVTLIATLDGELISGTVDAIDDDGVLRDWKMTSTFVGTRAVRADWEAQLNCYAWLVAKAGTRVDGGKLVNHKPKTIEALEATMIFRDWVAARAAAAGPNDDYPRNLCKSVDVPRWDLGYTEQFLRERLRLHLAAEKEALPPLCSDEERWHRPGSFAVKKQGAKRAMRGGVHASRESALAFAEHQGVGGLYIEERPGTDVRCENYCAARSVCPHAIALKLSGQKTEEDES